MSAEDALIRLSQGWEGDGPVDLIRLCLFDWVVCALAGQNEPVGQKLAMLEGGEGDASVIGGGQTSVPQAALINGAIGHALDYDDTHFDHIGHTSAVIMPAVLAVAEGEGIEDLAIIVRAALLGSEAAVRTGIWLGRPHYQVGFHQTATSGAIGAAVGCAHLLELSSEQVRNAIGLAATSASGLKGQFGTMGKPLNAGLAARAGAEAALWGQAGLTSDALGLSGAQGLGATHHGQADETAWTTDVPWKNSRVSHKFHACCHGLHAMLEALRDLEGDVQTLTVHTNPRWMSVCNNPDPRTGLEAKFSYPFTAAMTLKGIDTARPDSFVDHVAADAQLKSLASQVDVVADEGLSETQVRVDVNYADGRTATLTHDLDAPFDHETRQSRLTQKACAVVGARLADQVWSAVQGKELESLTALY